jgi:hypothetical protein
MIEVLTAARKAQDMIARAGPLTGRPRGDPRVWGIRTIPAAGNGIGSQCRYLGIRRRQMQCRDAGNSAVRYPATPQLLEAKVQGLEAGGDVCARPCIRHVDSAAVHVQRS